MNKNSRRLRAYYFSRKTDVSPYRRFKEFVEKITDGFDKHYSEPIAYTVGFAEKAVRAYLMRRYHRRKRLKIRPMTGLHCNAIACDDWVEEVPE